MHTPAFHVSLACVQYKSLYTVISNQSHVCVGVCLRPQVVASFMAAQAAAVPPGPTLCKRAVKDKIKEVASYQAGRGWVPLPPGTMPSAAAAVAGTPATAAVTPGGGTPAVQQQRWGGVAVTPLDLSQPVTAGAPPTTGGVTAPSSGVTAGASQLGAHVMRQLVAAAGQVVNGGPGVQQQHAGAPTPAPTPAVTSLVALHCPSVTAQHAQHAHPPPSSAGLASIPHMQPLGSALKGNESETMHRRGGPGFGGTHHQHPPCTPIPIAFEVAPAQAAGSVVAPCPGAPANTPAPATTPAPGRAAGFPAPFLATPFVSALQGVAAARAAHTPAPATTPGPSHHAAAGFGSGDGPTPAQQPAAAVAPAGGAVAAAVAPAAVAAAAAATPTPATRPITTFFKRTPGGGAQQRPAPNATLAELSPPPPPPALISPHPQQQQQLMQIEGRDGAGEDMEVDGGQEGLNQGANPIADADR